MLYGRNRGMVCGRRVVAHDKFFFLFFYNKYDGLVPGWRGYWYLIGDRVLVHGGRECGVAITGPWFRGRAARWCIVGE